MLHPRYLFFFFNDTATTEIYTLSLHDALPISCGSPEAGRKGGPPATRCRAPGAGLGAPARRADAKPAEQVGRGPCRPRARTRAGTQENPASVRVRIRPGDDYRPSE